MLLETVTTAVVGDHILNDCHQHGERLVNGFPKISDVFFNGRILT
jgi:hypothetical protein